MNRKEEKLCSDLRLNRLKKVKNQQNISSTLKGKSLRKKNILQLKIGDNEVTSDLQRINQEIESFYKVLLKTKLTESQERNSKTNFEDFIDVLTDLPKLSYDEQNSLESELTLEELKSALKSCQNSKSPGDDGFTKEFYDAFFDILGVHLLDSFNEGFNTGQLSVSQRRGVITLIPKDDSCLIELTNWHPITLLNVDYKILAKTIARRIEPILLTIIHLDQIKLVL